MRINDYGRIVTKMIDYTKQLPTRDERNRMATTILHVMAHLNPKIKERTDYQHILWDHLMIMANHDLDVDCPYNINNEENERFQPNRIPLPGNNIHYRHYGRTLENMIQAVADMPDSAERDTLTRQLANNMKRQYLQWNRDTVDDKLIAEQLGELSGGRLSLPDGFSFTDTEQLLATIASQQTADTTKKKKKKKKKQPANGKF